MVKQIQNWLNTNLDFTDSDGCRRIFEDAIKCYINDIPRAAMQLSYIAFLNCMKIKYLSLSDSALSLTPTDYNEFKDKLNDEDHFEPFVASLLDNTCPSKFRKFNYPENLTKDFAYWRRIRNDCAHYKNNSITLATVECFWNFLISKSHLFEPLGYIERIISEYNVLFDPSLTAPDSDDSKLFSSLISVISTKNDIEKLNNEIICEPKKRYDLIKRLGHKSDTFRNYIKLLINENKIIWLYFFRFFPDEIIYYYGDDNTKIREFWYSKSTSADFSFIYVLISIFNSGVIKENEKDEFFSKFVEFLLHNQLEFSWHKDDKINTFIISNTQIKSIFLSKYLCQSNFSYNYEQINYQENFYIKMISIFGMDDDIVTALSESFSVTYFPYKLKSIISSNFSTNSNSFDSVKYKSIISQKGLNDPFI